MPLEISKSQSPTSTGELVRLSAYCVLLPLTCQLSHSGQDGSRQVTLKVDTAGTGTNLVAGTVSKNGQKVITPVLIEDTMRDVSEHMLTYPPRLKQAPTGTGTEQITAALPAGAACAGGATKNLCLASFTTAGGFGNCVVVQQGGAAAGNATTNAVPVTGGNANSVTKGNAAKMAK